MLTGFRGGPRDRAAIHGPEASGGADALPGESSMPATLIVVALTSVLTVLWVLGAWQALMPGEGFGVLTPSESAAVLAALAAPPAVLWLGLAVGAAAMSARRSERALRAVLHHTRRATEQSEVQVRTLLQMQEDTRRRRMLEGLDEALADMRGSLALIAERTGLLSQEDTELTWARTAAGDRWAFANAFLTPWAYQPDLPEIVGERVAQAPEAAAALQAYLRRWRRLLAVLKENEADKLLRETLEDGPADRLSTFLAGVEKTAVGLMAPAAPAPSPAPSQHPPAMDRAASSEPFADVAPPAETPRPPLERPHSDTPMPWPEPDEGQAADGSRMVPTDFGEEPGTDLDIDLLPEPRRRARRDKAAEMPLFGGLTAAPAGEAPPAAGPG